MRTSLPNCYRIILRHGYSDNFVTEDLGEVVYAEVRKHIIASSAQHPQPSSTSSGIVPDPVSSVSSEDVPVDKTALRATAATTKDAQISRRLKALDSAYSTQVVFIVGKEQLRLMVAKNNVFKRFVLTLFLWIRDNTRAKVSSMKIPVEKLVEVGFVKEIWNVVETGTCTRMSMRTSCYSGLLYLQLGSNYQHDWWRSRYFPVSISLCFGQEDRGYWLFWQLTTIAQTAIGLL